VIATKNGRGEEGIIRTLGALEEQRNRETLRTGFSIVDVSVLRIRSMREVHGRQGVRSAVQPADGREVPAQRNQARP
jgi:hypothetical protein